MNIWCSVIALLIKFGSSKQISSVLYPNLNLENKVSPYGGIVMDLTIVEESNPYSTLDVPRAGPLKRSIRARKRTWKLRELEGTESI